MLKKKRMYEKSSGLFLNMAKWCFLPSLVSSLFHSPMASSEIGRRHVKLAQTEW